MIHSDNHSIITMPLIVSLIFALLSPLTRAKDVCQGPLVQLSVSTMESSSSHAFHGPFFGVTAYFGRQIYLNQTLSGPLVLASPLDACAPPRIGDDDGDAAPLHLPEGAVVLVQRGGCNFTDKARAVEAAGGVAMLLYDNVPGCITMGGGAETPVSLTIPSVSISQVRSS